MSSIALSFDDHSRQATGTPVFIEVFDEQLKRVKDQVVDVENVSLLDGLATGLHLVRASLPSGELLSATINLEQPDSSVKVTLESEERSPRETLSWAYARQSVRQASSVPFLTDEDRTFKSAYGLTNSDDSQPVVELSGIYRPLSSASGRWNFSRYYECDSVEDASVAQADERLVTQFSLSRPDFFSLEPEDWFPLCVRCTVRASEEAPLQEQCIMVPPGGELKLLFVRTQGKGRTNEDETATAVRPLVKSDDPRAEALLGFVKQGAVETARRVYEANAAYAFNLLQGKTRNPLGAIIGGYFLLQAGNLQRQSWMLNLSNWFDHLPDGAIIYASSLLRTSKSDRDEARHHFLRAVGRGLPIYTFGQRLLFDGLRRLMAENESQGKAETFDPDLRDVLAQVRFVAAYADWNSVTTAFTLPEDRNSWPLTMSD